MKKLSIIIPVYNKEKYLKKCLDSLVNKINDNIEIILIDDGSIDNSENVYKCYADFITIIKQENHGVSYARNVGLNRASGKYIMFVDSDDYLDDDWNDILECELENDYDLLFFSERYKNIEVGVEKFILYTLNLLHNDYYFSNPTSKLYNLNFLKNNDIFFEENIKNGEDMLFNLKCFLNNPKIKFVEKSFYEYVINESSVIRNFNEKEINSDYLFQQKLETILSEDSNLTNEFKKIICSNLAINGMTYLLGKIANSNNYMNYKNISNLMEYDYYLKKISFSCIFSLKKKLVYILKKNKFNLLLYLILKCKRKNNKNIIVRM